jgi:hypothetical protein
MCEHFLAGPISFFLDSGRRYSSTAIFGTASIFQDGSRSSHRSGRQRSQRTDSVMPETSAGFAAQIGRSSDSGSINSNTISIAAFGVWWTP